MTPASSVIISSAKKRLLPSGSVISANLSKAVDAVDSGPRTPAFTRLLLGPRGSGKTVLLAEIAENAALNGCFVVKVDAATPGLLDRISAGITQTKQGSLLAGNAVCQAT